MDILKLAQLLVVIAPDVFATVEKAWGTSQKIVGAIQHGDEDVSQNLWDDVHAEIERARADWKAQVAISKRSRGK